jgi:hypothetical protein
MDAWGALVGRINKIDSNSLKTLFGYFMDECV